MIILVTGGTGFVGRHMLQTLLGRGHQLRCLVRRGSEQGLPALPGLAPVFGDILDASALATGMAGCDAVMHLVGIIREFPERGISFQRLHQQATEQVLAAARQAGVRRYLHMSANGARPQATTGYHRSKWAAEEMVRRSGLDWTILRPSLIYGADGELVRQLSRMVRQLPLVPVFGDGNYLLQPVAVDEVTDAFARALEQPATIGGSFALCGAQRLSYNELLQALGRALGRSRVRTLHLPLALIQPLLAIGQRFAAFPVTLEQLQMLLEGNCCDDPGGAQIHGFAPRPFEEGIRRCFP